MGRPRAFDEKKALDQAMKIFWRKGYEGASIADLTAAMGINSPSLYGAFGSKEGLFTSVLNRYDATRGKLLTEIVQASTAADAATRFLHSVADNATDPHHPPGCLLVQAGLSCSDKTVPRRLARHRAGSELALRERFKCAKAHGDLPKYVDAATLARYVIAVANGMCVQASAGASRKELRKVADMALMSWPGRMKKSRAAA
jgi:AcrR family transcriptional regulator